MSSGKPRQWFENWFNQSYLKLYSARDHEEAQRQVEVLAKKTELNVKKKVLDLACGHGRHLRAFSNLGYRAYGLDLSASLLKLAACEKHRVARGDMRSLPFGTCFNFVTLFFSSFGYFSTPEEDSLAMGEFSRVLLPSGTLYLDLSDVETVKNHLVPSERREWEGGSAAIKRWMSGETIYKEICLNPQSNKPETHLEKLRLYNAGEMRAMGAVHGLTVIDIFCSMTGEPYQGGKTARMGMVFKKI